MKDSQRARALSGAWHKYIKESNERFSTSKQGMQANI